MGYWLTTREAVKRALDSAETARNNEQVDRAVEAASRSVEGLLNRSFVPSTGARTFPWPNWQYAWPWRLWLDADELVSVTSITSGGTTLSSSDYFLEPNNSGPPYTSIEINLGSQAAFNAGNTYQRSISITGVFGYNAEEASAGTLAAAISSTSATMCNVSDSSVIGVGSILRIDSERLIVTEKTMLTTGQTLQTDVGATVSDQTIAVTTGSSYNIGEIILLDAERMLVVDISGNNLIVKRAWDGTTLASHSGSTIYAPRTLTVQRGALGTTAATHLISTAIAKHVVPGLVADLTIAEAVNQLQQETSGYAKTVGSGDSARPATGSGLDDIRQRAYDAFGRKNRIRSI